MADFALDLSKIVPEKKLTGGAGKARKKRKLGPKGSAVFGTASSSPCGASSSLGTKVTSLTVLQKSKPIKKEILVIDVDLEMGRPFLLPKIVTDRGFLEKNPLQVAAVEKAAILEVDDDAGRDRILEDTAGLLRMLETVLVFHEDRSSRRKDLEKMKEEYVKLEAENMKLENEVVDLRGKKKILWQRLRKIGS
jgi:hypothetical protein